MNIEIAVDIKPVLIKLANGLEIVGNFIKEDDTHITLDHPALLLTDENGQRIYPYSNYSTVGEFQKRFIIFRTYELLEALVRFHTRYVERMKTDLEQEAIEDAQEEDEVEENGQPMIEELDGEANTILHDFFSDLKFFGRVN